MAVLFQCYRERNHEVNARQNTNTFGEEQTRPAIFVDDKVAKILVSCRSRYGTNKILNAKLDRSVRRKLAELRRTVFAKSRSVGSGDLIP